MKINLNKVVTGLDGQALIDELGHELNLGKMIAYNLASSNKGDSLKLTVWAFKLFNGEVLDLDKSDQKTLKEFVKESGLSNLVKYNFEIAFEKEENYNNFYLKHEINT
jgi:hypothetical protein